MWKSLIIIIFSFSVCSIVQAIEITTEESDGFIYCWGGAMNSGVINDVQWQNCKNAISGEGLMDDFYLIQSGVTVGNFDPNAEFEIDRLFLNFDTSIISDEAEIQLAKLLIFPIFKSEINSINPWITVRNSFQSDILSLLDYYKYYPVDNNGEVSSNLLISEIELNSWNSFILSEYGVGLLNKSGFTKFSIIQGDDLMDTMPIIGENQGNIVKFYSSEYMDGAYAPRLVIEYTLPGDDTIHPLVILPGIGGSWNLNGTWSVDPIAHTYDNLIETLTLNGYEIGKTLFPLAYDWRKSNTVSAGVLMDKIAEIKSGTDADKIDIVAHSMGGLVARSYVESDEYRGDVDRLIFLGTPHQGAPEAYPAYEAGQFGGFLGRLAEYKLGIEAGLNGYISLSSYIRNEIAAFREILPVYPYLYDRNGEGWELRAYPENYPLNDFLSVLNDPILLDRLGERARVSNIMGIKGGLETESTKIGYNVKPYEGGEAGIWTHGEPVIELMGPGDGTVPETSSDYFVNANRSVYNGKTHRGIVSEAGKEIVGILTGREADQIADGPTGTIKRLLFFRVYSPVDFQVSAPDNSRVGWNFDGGNDYLEYPGSYYSGHTEEAEFITIPEGPYGIYHVSALGIDNGIYSFAASELNEEIPDVDGAKVMGVISEGGQEEFEVNYQPGSVENRRMVTIDSLKQDLKELKILDGQMRANVFNFLRAKAEIIALSTNGNGRGRCFLSELKKLALRHACVSTDKQLDLFVRKGWISQDAETIIRYDFNSICAGF